MAASKYNWPDEVGETVVIATEAQPNSFRVLASARARRTGRRYSCNRITTKDGAVKFKVTRVA